MFFAIFLLFFCVGAWFQFLLENWLMTKLELLKRK